MRILLSLLIVALLAPVVLPDLGYGQQSALTPEQLTARAELVAVGTVTALHSEWNAEATRIVTRVTLAVEHYLKGNRTENTLTVVVPGGEVGETGESYSHTARFRNSEHVVVFAESDGRGTYRITAGDRGKLSITEDPASRTAVVAEGLSLDVLKSRVRTAVRVGAPR
jgi:hypothetical protein